MSLLAIVGCADVDANGEALTEDDALQQEIAATADAGVEKVPHEDLGKGDGRDVITIGDSWMSNTLNLLGSPTGGGISASLRGAPLNLNYRNYAVQGVLMLNDSPIFGRAIPTQWDAASRANKNIKTVIMTAGGNDVLQDPGAEQDCKRGGAKCKATLAKIAESLRALWTKMGDAGVQDVVYVGYSEHAGKAGADAASVKRNGVGEVCASMTNIRCTAIDSTPFVGPRDLVSDGIHPSKSTNDRLAKEIYKVLEQEGIRR